MEKMNSEWERGREGRPSLICYRENTVAHYRERYRGVNHQRERERGRRSKSGTTAEEKKEENWGARKEKKRGEEKTVL